MNLEEILLGGGGVLLVAMTLIQVAPIKVNPWSAIAKAIGRAINGEVIAKVDQLERDLEAMKAAQEERDAISCRSRILHFGDETIHGVRHTKEHFDQILRDITSYERYCDDHPHFENNTTVLTSQRIKDIYEDLRAKGPEIKLGRDHAFANFVERKIIEERYSPGAVLAYIEAAGLEFETHICETTLYSYIYRGDVFLELTEEHLLYKGERRRDYEQRERAKEAPGDTIEDRPPEVRARNTFGHWEMDSIMGPVGSKAALLVLTERLTRWGLVIRVPDHTAESVVRALNRVERRMGKRFREVFRTITVDNGSEFMDCAGLQRSYRLKGPRTKIYYCHPYSPQERGSNENMNRILRRWFPKGTNFDQVTEAEVAQAAEWMNNYPRRILGWRSAGAVFEEYVAA